MQDCQQSLSIIFTPIMEHNMCNIQEVYEWIYVNHSVDVFVRVQATTEEKARANLEEMLKCNHTFEFGDKRWDLIGDIPLALMDDES